MSYYIFASDRPWALSAFAAKRQQLPGDWSVVTCPADLEATLAKTQPRFVFFPHWSHIVPQEILDRVECVCFHMTDVPYGRGGSPLQNLIARGHRETKLTALRMSSRIDEGPVYCKTSLSLEGSATKIFERSAEASLNLISELIATAPKPALQEGLPVVFQRRKPEQSIIPTNGSLEYVFDHIRMLDAEGYPPAYLEYGPLRLTFSSPKKSINGSLQATVEIQHKYNLSDQNNNKNNLTLRSMQLKDIREVYDWRYSEGSAKYYLSNAIPSFIEHATWIERRLMDAPDSLLIGEIEGYPVSHLRIDATGTNAEVSIYVNSTMRGLGIGKKSLLALNSELQNRRIETATAKVSLENKSSIRLFESCGYRMDGKHEGFSKLVLEINPAKAAK